MVRTTRDHGNGQCLETFQGAGSRHWEPVLFTVMYTVRLLATFYHAGHAYARIWRAHDLHTIELQTQYDRHTCAVSFIGSAVGQAPYGSWRPVALAACERNMTR